MKGRLRAGESILLTFETEFECQFLGSVDTLVPASKIKTMAVVEPKRSKGFDVYEMPLFNWTTSITLGIEVTHNTSKQETN